MVGCTLRSKWLTLMPSDAAVSSRVSANRGTACRGRRGPAFGIVHHRSSGSLIMLSCRRDSTCDSPAGALALASDDAGVRVGTSLAAAMIRLMGSNPAERPSQRGETWNDSEAIDRHRLMTPSERVALAIEASRAALLFAEGKHLPADDSIRS